MSSDKEIVLTSEEFEELHEKIGSSYFKLQGEILKDFETKKLDFYFKSIEFTTSVTSVIGIIAGFGFTAIEHVQSMFLFIAGETLLLAALFHGIWWIQKIYRGEFNSINADIENFRGFFNSRNEKYIELYNGWLTKKSISKGDLGALNEMDKNSINLFKVENYSSPETYSKTTYVFGILGSVALLMSFFVSNLFYFLFCFFF